MPAIKDAPPFFALPPDALCLTPNGWEPHLEQVTLQLEGTLREAHNGLELAISTLWAQHKNLLGAGDVTFYQLQKMPPKGYVVFVPTEP